MSQGRRTTTFSEGAGNQYPKGEKDNSKDDPPCLNEFHRDLEDAVVEQQER